MAFNNLPPVDPDAKIPTAIQAQAARALQIQQEAIEAAKQETNPDHIAEPAPQPEPQPEPAPAPVVEDRPVPVQPEPAPKADDGSWEHKFNSMKGRWEASERRVKELLADVSGLRNVIATLELRQNQPAAKLDVVPEKLLTDDERNEFGPEFLDVAARAAMEKLAPQLNALQAENKSLREHLGKVGQVFETNSRQAMFAKLDSELPDWREINTSKQFLDWLSLPDPYSGGIRHDLMIAAFERNDSPRVAAFFRGFKAESAVVDPTHAAQQPDQGQTPSKVPLSQFVAPGRAKAAAGSPSAPTEKPSFTPKQVSQFYQDAAVGKYRGREAEYKRLEAQIIEAGREGRIR